MANYIIVGGTSGIGLKITENLSEEGHSVISISRNKTDKLPLEVQQLNVDIVNDDLSDDIVDSLDGIVYCPGTINLKPFGRLSSDDFLNDFQTNVLGAVKVIQVFEKKLKKNGNASIVMFSTVAVAQGMPFHSSVAASKAAVEGLARSLAAEFAPKIRVNVIAPSITATPLADQLLSTEDKKEKSANRHPMKRVGTANDIAAAASYLLSDRSTWVTGQVLHVDGGLSSIHKL